MNAAGLWSTLSVEPDETNLECDPEVLWQQYFRRQHLLKSVVTGEMHPDDLLDCLLEDNLSPDEYLESVEDALRPLF
jgi:hypothetical protein